MGLLLLIFISFYELPPHGFLTALFLIKTLKSFETYLLRRTGKKILIVTSPWNLKTDQIYLNRPPIKGISGYANRRLEQWLFWKMDCFGYRNNVKGNLRIISSFLTVCSFFFLLSGLLIVTGLFDTVVPAAIQHVETVIGAFFTAWITLFWHEKNQLYEKWKYLADLYNEVLMASPRVDDESSSFSYRSGLEIALVQDLIVMEMWSHPSFISLFEKNIAIAYLRARSQATDEGKVDAAIRVIRRRKHFDDEWALDILYKYQATDLQNEKVLFRHNLKSQKAKIN
jgi:membrane protein CcdC involved in cytochrome C biogenesis